MKYTAYKALLFLAMILVVSHMTRVIKAEASSGYACSKRGYTILSINGILTSKTDALDNSYALKRKLSSNHDGQEISVGYVYNPTHLAGAGDIMDSIRQGIFDNENTGDYDLIGMLSDASNIIKTQKVLLVGHSQGNFYANSFYKAIADQASGIPSKSIGVYAVATPSDHVAGGGRYVTSDTDKVIAGIVGHLPLKKILEPLDHISLQKGDDIYGHSFSGVYLKYLSPKIISDIYWSLDHIEANATQADNVACMKAPKITFFNDIQRVFLSISDAITSTIATGVRSVANTVGSLFNSVKKLTDNNGASAIGAVMPLVPAPENIPENSPENIPAQETTGKATVDTISQTTTMPETTPSLADAFAVAQSSTSDISPTTLSNTVSILPLVAGGGGGHGSYSTDTVIPQTQTQNQTPVSNPTQIDNQDQTPSLPDTSDSTSPIILPTDPVLATTDPTDPVPITTDPTNPAPITTDPIPDQVIDTTTLPTITIIGDILLSSIQKDSNYVDPGATAVDSAGNPLDVTSVSTVDPSTPGAYKITYTATDQSGNTTIITRTVYIRGIKSYFNATNKIPYTGNYLVCDIGARSVYAAGNDSGITSFVSGSNWQTWRMSTVNTNMLVGEDFRIIFANDSQAKSDCIDSTYIRDYSDTFHYTTSLGSSFVADDGKIITSFSINNITPAIVGIIDDNTHTITLPLPSDTDLTNMVAHITISPGATITPASDSPQDFTNPVVYTVGAPDGSTQQYTTNNVAQGAILSFDANNKIWYTGTFVVCFANIRKIWASGNNTTLTNYISSTNWQTAYQGTPNAEMPINKDIRFIFGSYTPVISDCTQGTYINKSSVTFYYTDPSGTSVVYGQYTPPILSSAKALTSFTFSGLASIVTGSIDESNHTVSATVPFGTDVKVLVPSIGISPASVIIPNTDITEDFTNPVLYTVTAQDGSTQTYMVTVTIGPDPTPAPDPVVDTTDPPTITSYMFNGVAGDITINPLVKNLVIDLTANKNVNWMSIKIENENDPTFYRIFQSGEYQCIDGTATCEKIWDGVLSSGGLLHNGTYRVRAHIRDTAGNDYEQYFSYVITVDIPNN